MLTRLASTMDEVLAESARLKKDYERVVAELARTRAKADHDRTRRERDRSEREAARTQAIIGGRLIIEQAKGIVAQRRGVSLDDAFGALRSYARDNNQTIDEVCALVVEATNAAGRRRVIV